MKKVIEFLEKITFKFGNEVHLIAIRNSFMSIIPFLVISGFATFINAVLLPMDFMVNTFGEKFVTQFGDIVIRINNGGFTIMSLMALILISYNLANLKKFEKPMLCVLTTLAVFFVVVPFETCTTLFGTTGIFLIIVISLTVTEIYMKLSKIDKLKIKLNGNIPQAVADSFNAIISISLIMIAYSVGSWLIKFATGYEFNDLVYALIQAPLIGVTASLPGLFIMLFCQTGLFAIGIHSGTVMYPIFTPLFTAALGEGALINQTFNDTYTLIGGTGCTLGLVIALLLQKRRKDLNVLSKMSLPVSLFNINEPIIFGVPIVYNLIMIIPFMLVPMLNGILAYIATLLGLVSKMTVPTAWSTPLFVNAYIGSAGDIRNVLLQVVLIIIDVFVWSVFVKIYSNSLEKTEITNTSETNNINV